MSRQGLGRGVTLRLSLGGATATNGTRIYRQSIEAMVFFWLASVLFVIVLAFLFRTERMMLQEGRARSRAMVMDGVRLAAVAAMFFALPAAEPRPLATIGLGLAAFAFIAVPSSWMLAVGGVDPKWELRHIQAEAAELMARYPSPMPADGAEAMRLIVRQVSRLATAETAPLCDLLVARYNDWIEGSQRPLDLGRRSIRIYDLQRELYGEEVRPPELEEPEATFRWRLYRVFNEMAECGAAERTRERKARFIELIRELDAYRRDDTAAFIDGLQLSAHAWLKSRPGRAAWQPATGVGELAPAVDEGRRHLWPRTSVFWGAILDETDRRELAPTREAR
jgi:hypothetical protein